MEAWIWKENLRPIFEFASGLAGHEFGDLDWEAVALGLRDTDYEEQRWFAVPLSGRRPLTLEAALDRETGIAWVRASAGDELELRLEVAAELMAEYTLTR